MQCKDCPARVLTEGPVYCMYVCTKSNNRIIHSENLPDDYMFTPDWCPETKYHLFITD